MIEILPFLTDGTTESCGQKVLNFQYRYRYRYRHPLPLKHVVACGVINVQSALHSAAILMALHLARYTVAGQST
jgi:hypothetical protein